jgi:hypothetical protein
MRLLRRVANDENGAIGQGDSIIHGRDMRYARAFT